jgi:hypothetical protein
VSRRDAQVELEQRLERERVELLAGKGPPMLLEALRDQLPELADSVYIIANLPEQYEDIYDVLIGGTTVVHVEIPRPGIPQSMVVSQSTLDRYREMHASQSKSGRRRLDAALRLVHARRPRESP